MNGISDVWNLLKGKASPEGRSPIPEVYGSSSKRVVTIDGRQVSRIISALGSALLYPSPF